MLNILAPLIGLLLALGPVAQAKNPVILVPGYGPPAFTGMGQLMAFFEEDGVPSSQIHPVTYPYKENLEKIRQVLVPKFKTLFAKYPAGTKFDVVTHSLGHFVALEALLEAGLTPAVDHYVGLAGIGMGQKDLPTGCGIAQCNAIKPLVPFPSPYAQNLLKKFPEQFASLNKCSLFSTDDNVLDNPYNAGAFEGGKNVELSGYRHNDFLRSHTIYKTMRDKCKLFEPGSAPD